MSRRDYLEQQIKIITDATVVRKQRIAELKEELDQLESIENFDSQVHKLFKQELSKLPKLN